jgi:quinol monooxygenase YgiN
MDKDGSLTIVTLVFDASDAPRTAAILARYVVVSRGHPGCLNIDLAASVTRPNRFLVIEKWESADAQRAHFDSADMVAMAEDLRGLLEQAPQIDLFDGISAQDLE